MSWSKRFDEPIELPEGTNYPMIFARIAMLRAIHRNDEPGFTDRKEHQWESARPVRR
jgi:hypothetical protein